MNKQYYYCYGDGNLNGPFESAAAIRKELLEHSKKCFDANCNCRTGAKVTWHDKYMRDPELADSIIQTLRSDLAEAEKRIEMLTYALERIRDIEWSQYSNRIDAIQQLAKQALQ